MRLRVRGSAGLTAEQLVERLHNQIKGSSVNKTDFALALLAQDPATWIVPYYIADGLRWLEAEVTPILPPAQVQAGDAA